MSEPTPTTPENALPTRTLLRCAVPLVAAPMAGGATTPELVRAAHDAGGLGFLAAGYLSTEALAERMQALAGIPYGVNLFRCVDPPIDAANVAASA